ncbi:hypothetical protein GYH30_030754 [Glycine max]|uniref:Uncharacterized protein n=1 Tax=Glycine max TaxID=3847 RepID=A0A0R0HFR8_SOYBN|nr:hypothetical protein GYH30_030754 [Glycine max]
MAQTYGRRHELSNYKQKDKNATACPLVSQLEEQLQRLRCSEATSSLSSSSVCHKLNDTLDLHDYTDKLLQLPIEQQVLAQECNDKCVDDLLEGSLRLLDISITLSSLEQMLLFISDPKGHSKHSRWSAISKLMQPKRVMCDSQESNTNEFEKVDAALQSLISLKPSSIENFESHMENLELCIQDLEIGVDQLSRKLIRNRVSLLNIFNF